MFGKNPTVFQKYGFDPSEALIDLIEPLIDPPLQGQGLGLEGRLVLNQLCLGSDERRHGLGEFVHSSVTLAATLGHATAPIRERSFYPEVAELRSGFGS